MQRKSRHWMSELTWRIIMSEINRLALTQRYRELRLQVKRSVKRDNRKYFDGLGESKVGNKRATY